MTKIYKKIELVDVILTICMTVLLIITVMKFKLKDITYADFIGVLILFTLFSIYICIENHWISRIRNGIQYELKADIDSIIDKNIRINKSDRKWIKRTISEIETYYKNADYNIEIYINRLYMLDRYYGSKNIEYGIFGGLLIWAVTELLKALEPLKEPINIRHLIASLFVIYIGVIIVFVFLNKVLFNQSSKNSIKKFLIDKEIEIVNNKINEILEKGANNKGNLNQNIE